MGTRLEQHTARYLADGDFPAFWLGFDDALREDALATRQAEERMRPFVTALVTLGTIMPDGTMVPLPPREPLPPTFTPEELLAALEPPKVAPIERHMAAASQMPSLRLRASQHMLTDWFLDHGYWLAYLVMIALVVLVLLDGFLWHK